MRRRHLPGVLRIEGKVYPKPWSLGIFLSEIAIVQSRFYYVALLGRKVVGYCGLMVSLTEGHITNIAVDPDQWGRGIATTLLLNAFEVAEERGVGDMTLEVRTSNRRAQRLYFSFGFQPAGIRKGYYQETNEDAIIMWAYDIVSEDSHRRRDLLKDGQIDRTFAPAVEERPLSEVDEHGQRVINDESMSDLIHQDEGNVSSLGDETHDEVGGDR
jgi:ribosomal-protein-alanine N-acetyltransferase